MDRKKIETKYKWNLSDLCASDSEVYDSLDRMQARLPEIKVYQGKLKSEKKLLAFLKLNEEIEIEFERISTYAYLHFCENQEDKNYVEMLSKIELIAHDFSIATSFYDSELKSYGVKFLTKIANNKKFENYRLDFLDMIRAFDHILREPEERVASILSLACGGYSDTFDAFDAIDVKFSDVVDSRGKKHKITQADYSLTQESRDRVLRKNAFNSFYKGFIDMQNTIATNYIASVKKDVAFARAYKYDSVLQSALFGDNLDESVYTNLINNVHSNLSLLHKYYALRKICLNLADMSYYDINVSLSKFDQKYTFDQMVDVVTKALAPMGEEYVNNFVNAINHRWIDVYPTLNKSTGAFATHVYNVHPFVLLNTVDNLESAFTLAHEMGHALHSFYSSKLPYNMADYSIFLAEIASTTNEVILLKYLYANAKNKSEKIYYLDKYLRMFKSTLFRQTMFSEFEYFAHECVENNIPLSKEKLNDYYMQLNKQYHGSSIKHDSNINYEWMRVPHFYRSYYVYKYATGLTSAINFASKIVAGDKDALNKYLKLLSSGSSDYSYNLLKDAGVDLKANEPYIVAFNEMKWALKELKELTK